MRPPQASRSGISNPSPSGVESTRPMMESVPPLMIVPVLTYTVYTQSSYSSCNPSSMKQKEKIMDQTVEIYIHTYICSKIRNPERARLMKIIYIQIWQVW